MRTFLLIPFLLIVFLVCSRAATPVITTPTAAQVSEFAANAKITLPASARPLGWREERGMDDALWLQVGFPVADLQTLLDGSPFRGVRLTNEPHGIFDFRDFMPAPPIRYRCGEQQLPNAGYLKIVVDESDATNVVVYLMWHET